MATKRRTADDFAAERAARRGASTPASDRQTTRFDNQPDRNDQVEIAAAQEATQTLIKTFEVWVVVGRGVQAIRRKANRLGGKGTFNRLMAENGMSMQNGPDKVYDKGTISRLETIMNRLAEVGAWHNKLPPKLRREWASPAAVFKHCYLFNPNKKEDGTLKEKGDPAPRAAKPVSVAAPEPARAQASPAALTVEQHFAALNELLQDEPEWVLADLMIGFQLKLKRLRKERRKSGIAERPLTAEEEQWKRTATGVLRDVGGAINNLSKQTPAAKRKDQTSGSDGLQWKGQSAVVGEGPKAYSVGTSLLGGGKQALVATYHPLGQTKPGMDQEAKKKVVGAQIDLAECESFEHGKAICEKHYEKNFKGKGR